MKFSSLKTELIYAVFIKITKNGGLPERSNGQSWKDCVPETAPRVRISHPPPENGIQVSISVIFQFSPNYATIPSRFLINK